MLQKCFIVCAGLLALSFSPSDVSAGLFVDDLDGFTGSNATPISSFQAGGNQQQVISTSVGTEQGAVAAIDGNSIFMTIDTTDTPPTGSGSYGGGLRFNILDTFAAGDLSSSDPNDYNIVFDVAANGFAPNNVDIFLNFFESGGAGNVLNQQIGVNQNNVNLAPFVTSLGATDDTVSVIIGLENFITGDVSGLANADRFQFQLNTRSLDENYSADADNVLILDNIGVELLSSVPEPTSLLLVAMGAVGLIGRRRVS